MGNCQASEAATVVIQHPGPGGRVERFYWPTLASEVMRSHPGHYVALVTLRRSDEQRRQPEHPRGGGTRVRLLRPKDTLALGQVYRLVTSQEVMKALRARKQEKLRLAQVDLMNQSPPPPPPPPTTVAADEERGHQWAAQSAPRQRQWRPSLQGISEAGN